MTFDLTNNNADALIAKVMKQFAFKHQYQVAKYFGVTAQTLSGWVKAGTVPDKYLMKFQLDVQALKKENDFSDKTDDLGHIEINNLK